MKKAFSLVDSSLTGSLVTNILLAGVLGLAMKQIWALINTLQILTQIPLLTISLPANLMMALQALADVSNLNIVPKSVVNWCVQTLTGVKAGTGGLVGNVGYLIIVMGGSVVALGGIASLAMALKGNQR